jgi:hypothetical protein
MAIHDTDGGRYDGDTKWDRAVGPMQFLPSTWLTWGPPGKVEGRANPQNIRAAATATAGYLCASGADISQPHPMALAVYSYNHSFDYVRLVLSVAARYANLTPDELGVNLLPTDKAAKKQRHKLERQSKQRKKRGGGTTTAGARPTTGSGSGGSTGTPAPTTAPSSSPSPSPSPSPSSHPLPTPLPSLTIGHL